MSESLAAIILCSITVPVLGYLFVSTKNDTKESLKEIRERLNATELNPITIATAIEQMKGIEQQTEGIEQRVAETEIRVTEVVQNYLIRFDEIKSILMASDRQNNQAHNDIRDMVHIIKERITNTN